MNLNKQNVIVGLEGLSILPREAALLKELNPWGFILFSRNIASPTQLKRLHAQLQEVSQQDEPIILIDQEGGRVSRLPKAFWRVPPSPSEFVKLYRKNKAEAQQACFLNNQLIAQELKACGINVNCAPMLDIAQDNAADIIHERGYGNTKEQVIALGAEVINGLKSGGVAPVIKHMPGHGRGTSDSHFDLPKVAASKEELGIDFAPFAAFSEEAMAMSAHIVFSAYDASLPASISPTMYEVMRNEIGFNGLIMTDDINMHALSGSIAERAASALQAGADIALHCSGDFTEMKSLLAVAQPLKDKSLTRAKKAEQTARQVSSTDAVKEIETALQRLLN
ncbi:glycosyl hydrolase [Agaribacter marinus]|uniref:beta-N-acetylhexosaminidase n=1 Tax=Agaribacter marinus TaxID=1431249 RepID=A0AA37SZD7_9ALTE|nr:glycosyl hydrolase [Agaribacter marinus]